MKKALLFLFILLQANLFSQELEPIVNQAKRWDVKFTSSFIGDPIDCLPNCDDSYSSFSLRIGAETLINGQMYFNVLWNGGTSSYYIREDVNHHVYLYNSNENFEKLIYNFDLQVGDVITLYQHEFESYDFTVTNVETVFYSNRNRKKITLQSVETDDDVWYEGIGSEKGLLFSGDNTIDNWYTLMCYFEDFDNPHQNNAGCNSSTSPMFDVNFFITNDFVFDHFLLNNTTIEYPAGSFSGNFIAVQSDVSNNVIDLQIGGQCENATSASVLVYTDSILSVLNRGGTTLQQCDPVQYPNGDNQEGRFFDILSGYYMNNAPQALPVYYEKSNDNSQLMVWTDENEKLVFNVSERLGIADKELKNQFIIFPNPVKDRLTIQTEISDYNVEIFSVLGKQVMVKNGLINQSMLDVSSFRNGIYFIKISNEQRNFSLKFVKD